MNAGSFTPGVCRRVHYPAQALTRGLSVLALLVPLVAQGEAADGQDVETVLPRHLTARDLLYASNASALSAVGRGRRQYCAGFVSGVEEALRLIEDAPPQRSVCLPSSVSARRLGDVYSRFVSQRGRRLDEPAAKVARDALAEAYPCPGAGAR